MGLWSFGVMLLELLTLCGHLDPRHQQQNILGKGDGLLRCHRQHHGCCHL